MKNIIAISMIKNESDIVEFFIRHTLSFVDKMLIYDHCSFDGTEIILSKLSYEFNDRLHIYKESSFAYKQSECITDLAKNAFDIFKADIVIPLDADEIVTNNDNFDAFKIRSILDKLDTSYVYGISYYNCFRKNYNKYIFDLQEYFFRESQSSVLNKIIIGVDAYNKVNGKIKISQGSHNVHYYDDVGNAKTFKNLLIDQLQYNHFSTRSIKQIQKKYVFGSLANIAKFGQDTRYGLHWLKALNMIINNKINYNDFLAKNGSCFQKSFNNSNVKVSISYDVKDYDFVTLLIILSKQLAKNYYEISKK